MSSSEGGIEGGAAVGVAELGAPGDDDEIGGMEVATGLPLPAQPVSAMAVMATRTVLCDSGRTVSPIEDSGSIPRAAERFLRFDLTQALSSNLAHGDLTQQLHPAVLADTLGYAPKTLTLHAIRGGGNYASYTAHPREPR